MSPPVSQSITRNSASNLALAFILLPRPRREGMAALYAFCRQVDDIADDESMPVEERRIQLAGWREDIQRACEGRMPRLPVNRELEPVIRRFQLRFDLFNELIRGVEMDLDIKRYATLAELEHYCYRVASVVGLLSIEIFGYHDPACRDYAVFLGKALQLTNILRDVQTDAARGRIYLPAEDLVRCGVTPEEILRGEYSTRYQNLARGISGHAREFYRKARTALPAEERRSMVAAELMAAVYWRLLERIESRQFNVFGPTPIRISKPGKLLLILQAWVRLRIGVTTPSYGLP